jgi:hypothetical protein
MENDSTIADSRQALTAHDAGVYLARVIGLPDPIPAQRMWHYARVGAVPAVRLGRRVWFQTTALKAFESSRGNSRQPNQAPAPLDAAPNGCGRSECAGCPLVRRNSCVKTRRTQ